jgi:TatD DNase family protein
MFVDSHCHLDCIELAQFDNNFDQLIQRCNAAGVEHMLCVSIDMDRYPAMLELVRDYPTISISVGVHPMADEKQSLSTARLHQLAAEPKVVAIGETGLDYYYHKGDRNWQQERFRMHVQAAVACDKPLIIHTRDAADDTLAILRAEHADQCRGVIHCFTETEEFARAALDLGFMISFSGITTFRNADNLRAVAKFVPEDRILIETDAPYLAPVPHRGKQNWPALVTHVAECVAQARGASVEHIAEITRNNFYRLFSINQQASE